MDIFINRDECIDGEFRHMNRMKFTAFDIACKKNGSTSRKVIEDFFDNYTRNVFGEDANIEDICKKMSLIEQIEEY
jgi:hypothetical protein